MNEVKDLQQQLFQIGDELHESSVEHAGKTAEQVYADKLAQLRLGEGESHGGSHVVSILLARCMLWAEIVLEKYADSGTHIGAKLTPSRNGKIDERFQDTYDKLVKIRNQLDQMNLTQAWSLRETDLYSFQRQLDRVDEARVDGNFLDAEGKPADIHAQRVSILQLDVRL